jgi:hypothetical protein
MKKTQRDWVIAQLIKKGKVSRNQALARYITRLGAYICDLKAAGFDIVGHYVKTKNGQDYIYTLIK